MLMDLKQEQQKACQDLLKTRGLLNGWLRQKRKVHEMSEAIDRKLSGKSFKALATLISWEKRFVVIDGGFVYVYNSETGKKAQRVIDLAAFDRIETADSLKSKDVAWPFKICSALLHRETCFSAISEDDRQKWMDELQKGIDMAEKSGRRETIRAAHEAKQRATYNGSVTSSASGSTPSDPESDEDYDVIPETIKQDENNSSPKSARHDAPLPPIPREEKRKGSVDSGSPGMTEYELPGGVPVFPKSAVPKAAARGMHDRALPQLPDSNGSTTTANGQPAKQKPPVSAKNSVAPPTQPKPKKDLPAVPQRKQTIDEDQYEIDVEYEMDDLHAQAVWKGNADEGTQLLKTMEEDGVFMVRDSTAQNGDKTLQVTFKREVKKYKIMKEGNTFRILGGQKAFDSVNELLKFYQKSNIPNYDTKLTKPYSVANKK